MAYPTLRALDHRRIDARPPLPSNAPPLPHRRLKPRPPAALPTLAFALALISLSLLLRSHTLLPQTAAPAPPPHAPPPDVQPLSAPRPAWLPALLQRAWPGHGRGRGPAARLPVPPPGFPHRCHVVGWDPARRTDWSSNSRAFCLTSAACIRSHGRETNAHLYFGADVQETRCSVDHPSLTPLRPQPDIDCVGVQHRHVHCAHGKYRRFSQPECPVQRNLSELDGPLRDGLRWRGDDEIGVIVPALPFSRNIFHFSYVAASVALLAAELPGLLVDWLSPLMDNASDRPSVSTRDIRLHIVMRSGSLHQYGKWQHTILDALLAPHRAQYRSLRVSWLGETTRGGALSPANDNPALCFRRAVLLDARRNLNAWPFANGTAVSHAGETVPAHSVFFRRAVFDAVGIPSALPLRRPVHGARFSFPLPPRVLGYSRREMAADPPPGELVPHGRTRRLSGADEAWLRGMLSTEGTAAGFEVREFKLSATDSVATQVGAMHGLGVVVGLHGSNLVNALFVRPFGGLVELYPGRTGPDNLPCYVAGLNAGLGYGWHTGEPASRAESGCMRGDEACWKHPRGRLVKLGRREHRAAVRETVRFQVERVATLHRLFPDGIPVRYDGVVGEFVIDDERVEGGPQDD